MMTEPSAPNDKPNADRISLANSLLAKNEKRDVAENGMRKQVTKMLVERRG
jgi:hypothetical protein